MRDAEILNVIHSNEWVAEMLAWFDFDVTRVANGPVEPVHLASGQALEMIAGDAAGGAFMLAGEGDMRPVVYVGSEGEGGLIAKELRDALALVVGLSSIHDATAKSLDDGGTRLREWLAQADEEIRQDRPSLDEDRRRLQEVLGLPDADGLLESLHLAQADEAYRPVNSEGDPFESMLA